MLQQVPIIDGATCASKNADDAKRMSQCRVSRHEATCASKNAACSERMSQQSDKR